MDDTERPIEEPFGPDKPDFTDESNENRPDDETDGPEADDETRQNP